MKLKYIKASAIRETAKIQNKRVSKDYLEALDRKVGKLVQKSLEEHNGGKKTLDLAVAGYVLGIG
jgi:hypothetical protein